MRKKSKKNAWGAYEKRNIKEIMCREEKDAEQCCEPEELQVRSEAQLTMRSTYQRLAK